MALVWFLEKIIPDMALQRASGYMLKNGNCRRSVLVKPEAGREIGSSTKKCVCMCVPCIYIYNIYLEILHFYLLGVA